MPFDFIFGCVPFSNYLILSYLSTSCLSRTASGLLASCHSRATSAIFGHGLCHDHDVDCVALVFVELTQKYYSSFRYYYYYINKRYRRKSRYCAHFRMKMIHLIFVIDFNLFEVFGFVANHLRFSNFDLNRLRFSNFDFNPFEVFELMLTI